MSIYNIYMCYQPIKNMKYIGPKAICKVSLKNSKKYILQHNILNNQNWFGKKSYHHIVLGFEAEKVVKTFGDQKNMSYSFIGNYKNINHGKIIKDIINKYDPTKYKGLLISTDISCIITKPLDIDFKSNYIFGFRENTGESDLTCNVVEGNLQHISFNTSNQYWSGICYLNNSTIKLLNFINKLKLTDPMFLWEEINYLQDKNVEFKYFELNKRQYKYINNDMLKSIRTTK